MTYEKLSWPRGFVALRKLESSGSNCETWLLKCELGDESAKLQNKRLLLVQALNKVNGDLNQIKLENADYENATNEGFDPNSGLDSLEGSSFTKQDPNNELEENEKIRNDLQDQIDSVDSELTEIDKSKLLFKYYKKVLPERFNRVDKPWLNFKNENEPMRSKDKKGSKAGNVKVNDGECDLFVAKLIEMSQTIIDGGRRINFSNSLQDRGNLKSLLHEGKEIMRYQWRYIAEKGKMDFESVFLCPVVCLVDVQKTYKSFQSTYTAAFISPYFSNGSVYDVVQLMGGATSLRKMQFTDELLLRSLRGHISCLAFLESSKIYHGSIKPSNLFVSSDGFSLCIGEFAPVSEIKRRIQESTRKNIRPSIFNSPEIYEVLTQGETVDITEVFNTVDFYKHDVFCLALCYLYLLVVNFKRDDFLAEKNGCKTVFRELDRLRKKGRCEELVGLLERMLIFDPVARPRWSQLMSPSDRVGDFTQGLLKKFQEFVGWNAANPEEETLNANANFRY